MKLFIARAESGLRGTNGNLYVDGALVCHTIERPWLDNQRRISCIPTGKYEVKKRWSEKHRWHLIIVGVEGRGLILFHPANDAMKELNGCIAPVTTLTGIGMGSESRKACEKLFNLVFPELDKGNAVTMIIQ